MYQAASTTLRLLRQPGPDLGCFMPTLIPEFWFYNKPRSIVNAESTTIHFLPWKCNALVPLSCDFSHPCWTWTSRHCPLAFTSFALGLGFQTHQQFLKLGPPSFEAGLRLYQGAELFSQCSKDPHVLYLLCCLISVLCLGHFWLKWLPCGLQVMMPFLCISQHLVHLFGSCLHFLLCSLPIPSRVSQFPLTSPPSSLRP